MEEEGGEKKKSILRAVGIETVFIGVIILIITGILIYLNIIPLSKFFPGQKTSPFPLKGRDLSQASVSGVPTDVPNISGEIEAVSDVENYSLQLVDKKALKNYFTFFHIWGKSFPMENGTYSSPIKKIVIRLTDKEQPNNKFTTNKTGLYMSTGTSINGNVVNLSAYLSDYILNRENRDRFFDQLIITAIFRMANYQNSKDLKTMDSRLNIIYKEIADKNVIFFKISKK